MSILYGIGSEDNDNGLLTKEQIMELYCTIECPIVICIPFNLLLDGVNHYERFFKQILSHSLTKKLRVTFVSDDNKAKDFLLEMLNDVWKYMSPQSNVRLFINLIFFCLSR